MINNQDQHIIASKPYPKTMWSSFGPHIELSIANLLFISLNTSYIRTNQGQTEVENIKETIKVLVSILWYHVSRRE